MSCCSGDTISQTILSNISDQSKDEELFAYGKSLPENKRQYVFTSPDIRCGNCISILERELGKLPHIDQVRVNLTLKRVTIVYKTSDASPSHIIAKMRSLGYETTPLEIDENLKDMERKRDSKLLRALAVAGFGAMNIMLLSVSTWSGANGSAKTLFHLISALIAIPTVLYSGQVFFKSALKALSGRHLNMDVPISLAVLLALAMSVFEALTHGDVVYFDASVSLLFFLLIGRYLDQMMRQKARNAVNTLARRNVRGANIIFGNGAIKYVPIDEIIPGMILQILPGEKIPVDGMIVEGASDIDQSLVNGESLPRAVTKGAQLQAGTLNLSGVLQLKAVKTADQSFLAEVSRMLEAAENGRGTYIRIADRMAQIYAPAVHLLALMGFIVWMFITGGDWHTSIYIAISILIITCPCALGLAVPVVHVIGAGRLFDQGILMKDGSALERLNEINYAVFDKTGTLTSSDLTVSDINLNDPAHAGLMKTLATHSSHPASRAIARHFKNQSDVKIQSIEELPGYGIKAIYKGKHIRLGAPKWVAEITNDETSAVAEKGIAFALEGDAPSFVTINSEPLSDAAATINKLTKQKIPIEILSGDNEYAVAKLAHMLDIDQYRASAKPTDKINHLLKLKQQGKKVLMVGDGINDAPALAAGHASIAPATASDVGRSAADFVFTRNKLTSIIFAMEIAKKSDRLIKQNFALALLYNMIAVPLAFAGFVTPLFAAIAMSASSIIVILNSMRLAGADKRSTTMQKHMGKVQMQT